MWVMLSGMLFGVGSAKAGGAAFSSNGKLIYTPDHDEKPDVDVLDIGAGTMITKHLKLAKGSQDITAMSVASDGRLWVLTESHLWLWDAISDEVALSETAPVGAKFVDVACDFGTGRVLITAAVEKPEPDESVGRVLFKLNAEKPAMSVFVRRIDWIECPVFLDDGTILFGCEGDLWHGEIELDDDGDKSRGILNAYRYAPLATRETYGGTPMQTGVKNLAVSMGKVYAHVRRMGGSGWGEIIRLDRPKRVEKGKNLDMVGGLKERLQLHQAALHSVEILEDNGGRSFLCNSPDENLVQFTGGAAVENGERKGDRRHYLITNDGKSKPLKAGR